MPQHAKSAIGAGKYSDRLDGTLRTTMEGFKVIAVGVFQQHPDALLPSVPFLVNRFNAPAPGRTWASPAIWMNGSAKRLESSSLLALS